MTNKTEFTIIDEDLNNDGVKNTQKIYEIKTFKAITPQIFASLVATSFRLPIGMSLSFTGILIPEIEKANAEIHATVSETSLIASVTFVTLGLGTLFTGYLTDLLGRINVMRLTVLPEMMGWILMALASNTTMLICGRALAGFAAAFTCVSSGVYVSETSFPKLRGTFLTTMAMFTSLGIQLVYLEALIMSWRTVAWTGVAYSLVLFLLTFFIPESYEWLMNKNKFDMAKASLKWFHKYQTSDTDENLADVHFAVLKAKCLLKQQRQQHKRKIFLSDCFKPTVYKPFFIIFGISLIQHFSGIYVIMAYTVTLFESIGTNMNPLIASNLTTSMPVLISLLNLYTMKTFGRVPLLLVSCSGMSFCLYVSGLFTKWISDGTTDNKWVPVVFIFIYMCFALSGLESIPWTYIPELLPLENRGALAGIVGFVGSFVMFAAVQTYRNLNNYLGNAGIQFFYGTVALVGMGYIYVFVPETHGKTLTQIEMNFEKSPQNGNETDQRPNEINVNNSAL